MAALRQQGVASGTVTVAVVLSTDPPLLDACTKYFVVTVKFGVSK
jgi:hypothetical protein